MIKTITASWSKWVRTTTPSVVLIYTFIVMIILGAILLRLPAMQSKPVGILDCLFISTSAACVTGLSTIDMPAYFNTGGQFVILILIQLGGLGVMTFASISFKLLGARLSLRNQAALEDSLFQRDAALEFKRTFKYIFIIVFIFELCGALLLGFDCLQSMPLHKALWFGVFHSVSAFCNAGFSLWSESLSGQGYFFNTVIMILIILGGLGHVVLVELARLFKSIIMRRKIDDINIFSYHTRIVLITSMLLLIFGAVVIYFFDPYLGWYDSLFQSVTARTAGFNTVAQSSLMLPAFIVMLFLMFVGGSPGSCAGGIKTTSLAIWCAHVKANLLGKNQATLLDRGIPFEITSKARQLVNLAIIWNSFGFFILAVSEQTATVKEILYEQVSAFGTVGLSLGLTGELSDLGKFWIIATMFLGRIGPLTIALSVKTSSMSSISHPEGRIMIG